MNEATYIACQTGKAAWFDPGTQVELVQWLVGQRVALCKGTHKGASTLMQAVVGIDVIVSGSVSQLVEI
jgi:hypothetical protein